MKKIMAHFVLFFLFTCFLSDAYGINYSQCNSIKDVLEKETEEINSQYFSDIENCGRRL